jgi:integrase
MAQYESHFDQFAKWIIKTHSEVKSLRDVTKDIAAEYAGHLAQRGLSANRFNKHIRFLSLFFRVLKDHARMATNPWEGINRKRQNANARRELTVDELRRICESATGELRLLLATGIYTGLRLGDAATLRWGEVDILRGIIRRIPHKTASRNPKPVLVPIHPALCAMLAEIPKDDRREYVMPEISKLYHDDPIVLNRNLQAHFKNNGITLHKPGTGVEEKIGEDGKIKKVESGIRAVLEVGFHSLRHTFVSLCRAANAPLSVVESIVGHSNPSMTRHYTHTSEAAALTAVSALPSVMGGEVKTLPPAPSARLVDGDAILAIIQDKTVKTWKDKCDAVVKLIGGVK